MAIVAKKIQDAKVASINELKEAFSASPDFIFTNYRGLSVAQITELRKKLREKEASYKVIKNNFARIAFQELSAPDAVKDHLSGPTAIAIAPKDANEVAKILVTFAKENVREDKSQILEVKGALIGQSVYNAQETEAFSKLPGKLELIAQTMSVINGPARGIAAALNEVPSQLVRTIKAVADTQAEEGGAPAPAPEAAAA
jgi:large subunit ribosomal protein L10